MENVNPCLAGRQVKTKNDTAQSPGPSWSKILVSLTVLVVLVIGYGFLAKANNWWPHEVTNPTPSTSDVDTTGWQTYRDEKNQFEFKYPSEIIKIISNNNYVTLYHSIPFEHRNSCDQGSPHMFDVLHEYNTFQISMYLEKLNLEKTLRKEYGEYEDWIVKRDGTIDYDYDNSDEHGTYTFENGIKAYRVVTGVEMCGSETYYISLNKNATLVINVPFDDMFYSGQNSKVSDVSSISLDEAIRKYNKVPYKSKLMEDIISTVKLVK